MSILVTGGAGYIGSHMVHALIEIGESVVVLDNLSTGFKRAIPKGVELIDDALVTGLITGREVPLGYYRSNTVKFARPDRAIRGDIEQFIFSSTAAVYGNPAKVPTRMIR